MVSAPGAGVGGERATLAPHELETNLLESQQGEGAVGPQMAGGGLKIKTSGT